jgi:hypothetical protein
MQLHIVALLTLELGFASISLAGSNNYLNLYPDYHCDGSASEIGIYNSNQCVAAPSSCTTSDHYVVASGSCSTSVRSINTVLIEKNCDSQLPEFSYSHFFPFFLGTTVVMLDFLSRFLLAERERLNKEHG